jgi:holin-like protein
LSLLVPLAVLLGCQLVGEALVRLAGLPVPGPVLGMILLFAALSIRGAVPADLARVANGLLAHLSLLFVPAGVGVILHLARIEVEWPAIIVALVVSTWLTLAVGAGTMRLVSRLANVPDEPESAVPSVGDTAP